MLFFYADDRQTKQRRLVSKKASLLFASRGEKIFFVSRVKRENVIKSKISSSLSLLQKKRRRALLVLSLFLSFSLSFGWLVGWLKLFRFEESEPSRKACTLQKNHLFFNRERENERENEEFLKNERKRDSNNNNNNNNNNPGEEEEDDDENNINVVLADTFNGLFRDDTPRSGFDRDVLPSDVFALQLRTHRRRADERDVV